MNKKVKNTIFTFTMLAIMGVPTIASANHNTSIHSNGGFDSHNHRSTNALTNKTYASGNSDWVDVISGKLNKIYHKTDIYIKDSSTGKTVQGGQKTSYSSSGCAPTAEFSVNTRNTYVEGTYTKL